MKKRPIVAAYYFPNWHSDPRIEALHGKGWTEWRVAEYATPRFPGMSSRGSRCGGIRMNRDRR